MRVIEDIREMRDWSEEQRLQGKRIVLVPTMGYLHEGHLSLVRDGRRRGDRLVVSIFVNPAQFAPDEDFARYPRDIERDRRLLEREGVHILFQPSPEAIYPGGYQTYVDVERLSRDLCGIYRPGHFRGVATVVVKLFNIVCPHVAVFGLKDYQQFLIVRRLAEDLNFDIEVVGCPTVRDRDGLALSSRNEYLTQKEREAALCLQRALRRGEDLVRQGERAAGRIVREVTAEIASEPLARIEYVRLCDPESLEVVETMRQEALLALAVRIGKARLIDDTILRVWS
ncbi:MAG: pantoate--beta-alanine ligase [Candidatus Binatia bacterium]